MQAQLKAYMMRYIKITEKNRELVKAFMIILRDIGVDPMITEMITSMLKNKTQMDTLVRFIEENPNVTGEEILDKAIEIVGI